MSSKFFLNVFTLLENPKDNNSHLFEEQNPD